MITRIQLYRAKEFEKELSLEAALLDSVVITDAHGTEEEWEDPDPNLVLFPKEPDEDTPLSAVVLEILARDDSQESRGLVMVASQPLGKSWVGALYHFVVHSLGVGPGGNEATPVTPDPEKLQAVSEAIWDSPACRSLVTQRIDRLTLQIPAIEETLRRLKLWEAEAGAPFEVGDHLLLPDPPQVVEVVRFECWRGEPAAVLRSTTPLKLEDGATRPAPEQMHLLVELLQRAQRVVSMSPAPEVTPEPAEAVESS